MTRGALVLTTIYDNNILEAYWKNFTEHNCLDSIEVYLIPDKKTPAAVYAKCQDIKQKGLRVTCPALDEQETFLSKVGLKPGFIPYNTDNRRNVGYLMALNAGVDFVISIDDDNYCIESKNFFAEHSLVCENALDVEVIHTDSGWFNVCTLLHFDQPGPVYPRGFPYYARHQQDNLTRGLNKKSVHINTGLWLQAPDIDGISWLVNPVVSQSFCGQSVVLDRNIWTPLNTQNTSLRAEAIAAFYYIRMNYPLMGPVTIDRYGDIFAGYFVQACMHHLGGALRVGTPIAEHLRHGHNYLNDALREMSCLAIMEDLLPWLTQEAKLEGTTYPEAYQSLSFIMEDAVEGFTGRFWNDSTRGYFHQMAYSMRKWAKTCQSLLGL
jgi:hypothetical protein